MAWSVCTDLQDHQKGMAVELVLGGTARELIRELPICHKTVGVQFDPGDGKGPRHYTGLEFILFCLTQHLSHLVEEGTSGN